MDIEKRREIFESRLKSRRDASQKKKMLREEERENNLDPSENKEEFWLKFNRSRDEVIASLEKLLEFKVVSSTKRKETAASLDGLSLKVSTMQKETANASYFLPSYDSRSAQQMLNDLFEQIQNAKTSLIPRSKFSFKKARKKHNSEDKPKDYKNKSTVSAHSLSGTAENSKAVALNVDERILEDKVNENLEILTDGSASIGKDARLSRLDSCTVSLLDVMGSLRIFELQNCTIYSGPVAGSAFFENCQNCTFIIASRQIRIHNCTGCDFYLLVSSNPIIEDCTRVRFSKYHMKYSEFSDHIDSSGLDLNRNLWNEVHDFKWLRAQRSPNWGIIPAEEICLNSKDTRITLNKPS